MKKSILLENGQKINNDDIKSVLGKKCFDYDGNEYKLKNRIIYNYDLGYFMTRGQYNRWLEKQGKTGRVEE